nr:acetyl-CoA carboxyl transferase [Propionibacterium sp.]
MARPTLTELLNLVLDPGSFTSWDAAPAALPGISEAYAADLAAARASTGRDESVVTGCGRVRGRRVAVLAGDPAFLGGSIGVASAERLTAALERATREQLPVVAFPVGGGTRMQEGTVAFLQMAKITQAVMQHKAANLPYLVYLRHPTMGGVFASWGSLGHVQLAEPGAMIGFLGPRVYEALYGQPFPPGVQVAENLQECGIVDAVVAPERLAEVLGRILGVLMARRERGLTSAADRPIPDAAPQPPLADVPAWTSIEITRRPDRPGVRDLLDRTASEVTMLSGTGDGQLHPGSVLALARFGGAPCVVLGQCRQAQSLDNPLDPAALREARRGMRLSRELRLPLVTVIDTPGAALSRQAEERGLAGEIARSLADLVTLPTPTLSVLLGQGSGGIALALPCDRVLASEHAWLAPLPPEGASAIVHRDTAHAAELAAAQGVRAADLLAHGIVDRVIPEPEDAAGEVDRFCAGIADALGAELTALMLVPRRERLRARTERLRSLGLRGGR